MRFSFFVAKALRVFAVSCISALLLVNVFAQTGKSVVSGTIRDGQGNVIPGATVTLLSDQGASNIEVASMLTIRRVHAKFLNYIQKSI